jgi:hypothetical protein
MTTAPTNEQMIQCAICWDCVSEEFKPHGCRGQHCFHKSCLERALLADKKCPTCRQMPVATPAEVHWTQNTPAQDARYLLLQAADNLRRDLHHLHGQEAGLSNALIVVSIVLHRFVINDIIDKLESRLRD